MAENPFRLHRLALVAVTGRLGGKHGRAALSEAITSGGSQFSGFVGYQKLASLWSHRLAETGAANDVAADFVREQRLRHFAETAMYAVQQASLRPLDQLFTANAITYAIFKGVHLRELVYPDPALRPASDIDILVHPDQREAAARALISAGFTLQAEPENISHEVTLTRGPIAIDLHWDMLRPGRTRIDMAEPLLTGRVRVGNEEAGFWGLSDTDALFLMLVHPAFTRYVCSPTVALSSMADVLFWLESRPVDWDRLAARLEQTGLKTAAWAQLAWLAMLVEPEDLPAPPTFLQRIRPGQGRAWYLEQWLRRDLPGRFIDMPLLIQAGLTLVLHDRGSDTVRALQGWRRARQQRHSDPLLRLART